MSENMQEYIESLRHSVIVANLNYDIYKVYKETTTRQIYLETMNRRRYRLFFQTSIHAHFVAMLVALYRIYENRRDTYCVPRALLTLENMGVRYDQQLVKRIRQSYEQNAKPLWKKVSIIRNKMFAHHSVGLTLEDVFQEASVSLNDLQALIDCTKRLLNEMSFLVIIARMRLIYQYRKTL